MDVMRWAGAVNAGKDWKRIRGATLSMSRSRTTSEWAKRRQIGKVRSKRHHDIADLHALAKCAISSSSPTCDVSLSITGASSVRIRVDAKGSLPTLLDSLHI